MAIDTAPAEISIAGTPQKSYWLRPGIHTGIIGAALGYLLGHWLGNFLAGGYSRSALDDQNDVAIVLGYLLAVVGWLAGLGVFNDLGKLVIGRPLPEIAHGANGHGYAKYFRYTLDHKVVGLQYL